MPTFCLTEGLTDFEIIDIQCIPANSQDREASSFATQVEEPADWKIGAGGSGYRNTHTFILSNGSGMSPDARERSRELFNKLGFTSWTNIDDANHLETTLGNSLPTNMVISTQAPAEIRYQSIIYLKQNKPDQLDYYDFTTDTEFTLSETLPYLQFHIETLDAITYEGNFIKGTKSRAQNTAVKVLQNIPKQDSITLFDAAIELQEIFTNYDYEVYNPLYVALNNPAPIMVNQIKGRLVSPTNELMTLDNFENTPRALVMLHFRKELATN